MTKKRGNRFGKTVYFVIHCNWAQKNFKLSTMPIFPNILIKIKQKTLKICYVYSFKCSSKNRNSWFNLLQPLRFTISARESMKMLSFMSLTTSKRITLPNTTHFSVWLTIKYKALLTVVSFWDQSNSLDMN